MTDSMEKVIDRVRKLLAVADKNPNEAEAAAFTAKAQELLVAHNLDMSTIQQGGGTRVDERVRGGMYLYERRLWESVAELNFCFYWTRRRREEIKNRWGWQFSHRVAGRTVNVRSTQAMAGYLQQAIERLCRERLGSDHNTQFFSRWAVAFREGAADRICEKLAERRRHLLSEERQRTEDAAKAARAAGRTSTATALTIANLAQTEHDANTDFIYGEGTTARWAAQQAERARAYAEAERAAAEWATAHPEEAAKEATRERAQERTRARRGPRYRQATDAERRQDSGGYYEGYDRGGTVSLDQQVERKAPVGRITHG